ncbi:hypothetical protein [Streptomyces hilarionis]|uniref:hypothetical protein n=1 Tax=Streptomyces hilarionis TaxID=2839954 RepID=UPI00211A365A|nr:hypothetical protein [Streptomyces hilarionis]MCQ9131818.1 hypothetical protein [Streptomyces hilarionis]
MGRTAHFLSALALAGAVLGVAGPAAFADPSAEVSPGSAAPGDSVSVSVACGPLSAPAPESLDATSQAFADGTVKLTKVPGDDAEGGTAYRGTARIAPADDLEAGPAAAGAGAGWTVDGTCPAAPGGTGKPWSATLEVANAWPQPCPAAASGPSCPTARPCPPAPGGSQQHAEPCATARPCARPEPQQRGGPSADASCAPAPVEHGVQAGEGGAFTDSVPALVAGAVLIAGAFGAAVHRLRRRTPGGDA